ncbi:MAG: hypothetical protein IKE23_02905, partial [Exiguobacterium sp.]|nr:hypothetical protein [Exiguobacterium sp.]
MEEDQRLHGLSLPNPVDHGAPIVCLARQMPSAYPAVHVVDAADVERNATAEERVVAIHDEQKQRAGA